MVATVKKIIECFEKGGLVAVKLFLSESKIYEGTWPDKIKKLIDEGLNKSVEQEIELVSFNINLKSKLYEYRESSTNCK